MKRLGWLACVLSLAVGTGACNADDANNDSTARTDSGISGIAGTRGDGTIRVADVVAAPNEYFGRTVTIEADVEEVFGPRAFALDEDAPFAGGIDNDLLVLSKAAGSLADIDDQWLNNKVRVTGTVGRMSVIEVERVVGISRREENCRTRQAGFRLPESSGCCRWAALSGSASFDGNRTRARRA